MLSRVAENVYWMARHLERAENTARLVLVRSETRLDHPDSDGAWWRPALEVNGIPDPGGRLAASERDATNALICDRANPSSIVSCCAHARENVRILRETLPRETWEAVQALHEAAQRDGAAAPARRDEHLREVVARVQGLAGLFLGAMNDDQGAAFLRLGRAVERGDFGVRVLREAVAQIGGRDETRAAEWIGVLRSLTAYQMYRQSVRGAVTPARVVRFLVSSAVFPRSLAYCAGEVGTATARLRDDANVWAAVENLRGLVARGEGPADGVGARLADIGQAFGWLHAALTAAYFTLAPLGQVQAQEG